jgi:hypothetical protein
MGDEQVPKNSEQPGPASDYAAGIADAGLLSVSGGMVAREIRTERARVLGGNDAFVSWQWNA